jgi:hypothetical protein
MDRLHSRPTDAEQGLRHRTQQPVALTGYAAHPVPAQPPTPTALTRLTTTMLHALADRRTRFVAAGLLAVSLNVGSIPAACAMGGLYVAGNGITLYQIFSRPGVDDELRAVNCFLEATNSFLCASLFFRAIDISTGTREQT